MEREISETQENLPFNLQLAAKTVALDLVYMPRKFSNSTNKIVIKTINFGKYENRLMNKCVNKLTADIYAAKKQNLNTQLCINTNGFCSKFYNKGIFKCVDLNYDLT